MPLPARIIRTVDRLLTKYNPSEATVYKRKTLRVGGDPLIGKGGTITTVDSLMSPQPMLSDIGLTEDMVFNGTLVAPDGAKLLMCSPTSLSLDEIGDKDLVIVLRYSPVQEEEYSITGASTTAVVGTAVLYQVQLRSKKR